MNVTLWIVHTQNTKITVDWNVITCTLVAVSEKHNTSIFRIKDFHPEKEGSRLIRNVCTYLQDDLASHHSVQCEDLSYQNIEKIMPAHE